MKKELNLWIILSMKIKLNLKVSTVPSLQKILANQFMISDLGPLSTMDILSRNTSINHKNHLKLNKYDANSGLFLKTLIEEKDDKYVHPLHPIIFLDNEKFLWRSEKDGFDQLYLYNKKGKLIKKVTNGDLVVKEFLGQEIP